MVQEFKKKELTFKGKSIEELKNLDIREFSSLVNSRSRRTLLRQTQEMSEFLDRCEKKIARGKLIKTHKRNLIIVPKLVGVKISVYNGKEFIPIEVTIEMLGHCFGEFSQTRTKAKHTGAGTGGTKGSKPTSKK
jgi:small subunit ribosomal protein S19